MGPDAPPLRLIAALILGGLLGMGLLVVIVWPFIGTLIRYWANYTPKGIALGDETRGERGTLELDLPERNVGYWGMLRRVKRVEGFGGLWKGAGVYAIFVVLSIVLVILIGITVFVLMHFFPFIGKKGIFVILPFIVILSYLITIPVCVVVVRSIATSKKLWVRQPIKAYRALLNPFERRNPFRLCLLPGLAFGIILADLVQGALAIPRGLIMAKPSHSIFKYVCLILLDIVMALAVTPLHVAIIRLALQERAAPVPQAPVGEEGNILLDPQNALPTYQEAEGIEFAGAEEDVINIRSGQVPYKGLIDCMKSISKEEGIRTLWRGWYLSVIYFILTGVSVAVSPVPPKGGGMGITSWLSMSM